MFPSLKIKVNQAHDWECSKERNSCLSTYHVPCKALDAFIYIVLCNSPLNLLANIRSSEKLSNLHKVTCYLMVEPVSEQKPLWFQSYDFITTLPSSCPRDRIDCASCHSLRIFSTLAQATSPDERDRVPGAAREDKSQWTSVPPNDVAKLYTRSPPGYQHWSNQDTTM